MDQSLKPRIVLSGVNFVEAGPLAIMRDAIEALTTYFPEYEVHALVYREVLFAIPGVVYHEYPEVKRSWLRRLWFEYMHSKSISEAIRPYLWVSMHDMTSRVTAPVQAVYCHNPAPFYRMGLRESLLSYKNTLFSLFYGYLYGILIRRNTYVIVQQDWMRRAFQKRYRLRRVIVAHPSVKHLVIPSATSGKRDGTYRFLYPAFPRSFKNVEVLLEASRLLEETQALAFEVRLTLNGTENPYARQLHERYASLRNVRWLGALSREAVLQQYAGTDAMLFPSRLETWGMPLTEFKETGRPILAADLPYAHETVGTYGSVGFLPARDAEIWARAMRALCEGEQVVTSATAEPIEAPFAENWRALFSLLLGKSPTN